MGGQLPHLDYPYYEGFFPDDEADSHRPLLGVAFMVMLSKFTVKNGGTAFRPGSQKRPIYPSDTDEFYRNMVQLQGRFDRFLINIVFILQRPHLFIAGLFVKPISMRN